MGVTPPAGTSRSHMQPIRGLRDLEGARHHQCGFCDTGPADQTMSPVGGVPQPLGNLVESLLAMLQHAADASACYHMHLPVVSHMCILWFYLLSNASACCR